MHQLSNIYCHIEVTSSFYQRQLVTKNLHVIKCLYIHHNNQLGTLYKRYFSPNPLINRAEFLGEYLL